MRTPVLHFARDSAGRGKKRGGEDEEEEEKEEASSPPGCASPQRLH